MMMTIPRKKLFTPLVTSLLACSALTLGGCGMNREPPPRYNTVVGEKHAPVLNPNGQGVSGLPIASAPPYPIPPGPPPYATPDDMPVENTVSVVPMPNTPQTMAGMPGAADPMAYPSAPGMMPAPPQEQRSWYSGVTDMFGGGEENAVQQHAELPRKTLPGNREAMAEELGYSAAPVEGVATNDMSAPASPLPGEDATTLTELPADTLPPPMSMDSQGYPVLAQTPPMPENPGAHLEAAQESLHTMEAERNASLDARAAQETFDAPMAPAPSEPAPLPSVTNAPAEEWHPIGEPPVADMAVPPAPPVPMPIPQPMDDANWQAVAPVGNEATQQAMLPPPPPPAPSFPAPVPEAEPMQVMQDIPASSIAADDGLPPITLIPPSSVAAEITPAVRGNVSYIPPSRYEQRREAQKLSPFRHQ